MFVEIASVASRLDKYWDSLIQRVLMKNVTYNCNDGINTFRVSYFSFTLDYSLLFTVHAYLKHLATSSINHYFGMIRMIFNMPFYMIYNLILRTRLYIEAHSVD